MPSKPIDYSSTAPPSKPSLARVTIKVLLIAIAVGSAGMSFLAYAMSHDSPAHVNAEGTRLAYILAAVALATLSAGIIIRKYPPPE